MSLSISEVRSCCSVRMIPLMLVDEMCQSIHISLVDKNGWLWNINTLTTLNHSEELLKASDFRAYSVITESDYVWEAINDDGGYKALSPDIDTKLKLLQHPVTAAGELPPTFLHDGDHFTVDFSRMQLSSFKSGNRQIRQSCYYWCHRDLETGFIRRYDNPSNIIIEEMYRYGGRFVSMGGTQYTFMFSPVKSYQVDISSGNLVEIMRYPPVNSNPCEIQVNVSLQGNPSILPFINPERNLQYRELNFSFSSSDKLKQVVLHQLANVTRSYCVSAEHNLLGDKITSKIYGARGYVDRVYALLNTLTLELCQQIESQAVSSNPPSRDSTSLSVKREPQTKYCELKSVSKGSLDWERIYSHMKQTLPNISIIKIDCVQNKPLQEKYELEKRQMEERNKGKTHEKYLFHGSRATSPEKIALSPKGFDFRCSTTGKLMWGKGAYFAVKAAYSDKYSHQLQPGNKKQMLVARVLTGKSCSYGTKQNPDLYQPPPLPTKGLSSQGPMLSYDTVNGETNGSQVYIVYDHDKSYPAFIITYTS
ncbi:uncharacterized protein LOC135339360 [Halichondria panicea]|uniref:uncharacterized protein LOC135339360 n=1 Tax=Halichondria panicea TaxID=6063 RepID=UPI00312B440A